MEEKEKTYAPFPYFGGKKLAVPTVWESFGDIKNYVEPFAGSAAMLLGAPETGGKRTETINDFDGFVANFWRSIVNDPEGVAYWADYPCSESDLEARHGWLVNRKGRLKYQLEDPDFFDSVTIRHGLTGVFLDPPYDKGEMDYGDGGMNLGMSGQVREWCKENGNNPKLRIVLCGHAGEHDELLEHGWFIKSWKARKGYAITEEVVSNSKSETLWCSPHCSKVEKVSTQEQKSLV